MATLNTNLNTYTVQRTQANIYRVYMLFHFIAILTLFYYRFSQLLRGQVPILAWGLMTSAEFIFTFFWVLSQPFRLRPVVRSVYPEHIPGDMVLPGVDVFVCTADPTKEPRLEVMNTVLSAMALDYPAEKLAVYLSDDGGSELTLCAVKEACLFARSWIPFCRKYGIKTRSPEAYFSSVDDDDDERLLHGGDEEFKAEEEKIKSEYDMFKKNVEKASKSSGFIDGMVHDRAAHVEIIHDSRKDNESEDEETKMPLLVYVSREKRPSHPHRFKGGALNALLRVSGIMSNGPYLLVLDCDMYCNDPSSARQAMCFHLDPKFSKNLSFVQYPQMFYNLSKNDIYDGQARSTNMTLWQGMDGIKGPLCSGTGYYMKKKTLYGSANDEDKFLLEPEKNFGLSSKFNASLRSSNEQGNITGKGTVSDEVIEEAKTLASCTFEKNTQWGKEIGYSYDCLLESSFTGYLLHCRGWESVYLYPKRACFLGCTTIDMKDTLVQLMKWSSGLIGVAFSRYSTLVYGMSRMSILQSMCYAYLHFSPFSTFSLIIYGIVPQLCLLTGIPVFPKISNPWFGVFLFIYTSINGKHMLEVLLTGGTIRTVWNENRIWMIRAVSSSLLGCLDFAMKRFGITKAKFRLTNKAMGKEKLEKYQKGKFDFEGADMFLVPLRTLVVLNLVCLIFGLKRVIITGNFEDMFGQVYISLVILAAGYPILEGLIISKR